MLEPDQVALDQVELAQDHLVMDRVVLVFILPVAKDWVLENHPNQVQKLCFVYQTHYKCSIGKLLDTFLHVMIYLNLC